MIKIIRRFTNSSIPLAIKWSMVIACFVSVVMGTLGAFLLDRQTSAYRSQNDVLGRMVVDQLALAASEPLLAGDDLTLQILVSQQEKNDLIIGMQVFDPKGVLKASAGIYAIGDILSVMRDNGSYGQLHWRTTNKDAISFFTYVVFQDVTVGIALVTIDQGPLEVQLQSLTRALVTTTLGLILLGAMLTFPLVQRLYRPIHQLVEAGDALGNSHGLEKILAGDRKDEIGRLLGTFQHLADGMEKKREVEDAFSRFVSPSIAHQVLSGPEGLSLGGVTTEGSVLFCDIVGFTELSEYLQPEEVGEMLNQYFSYFSIAADSCRGTVDKFIGDCIMILFGVPDTDEAHGLQAVTCAVLIQEIAVRVNHQRKKQALPIVQFRIGINSGKMLAGNLGSKERMQYTVVGDVVNLSSRICDLCAPGEILVTQATLNQSGIDAVVEAHPKKMVHVKGRRQPVTPYAVDAEGLLQDPRVQASLERILPLER